MLKIFNRKKKHRTHIYNSYPLPNDNIRKIAHRRKLRNISRSLKKWSVIAIILLTILAIVGGIIFYVINYVVYLKTGHSLLKIDSTSQKSDELKNVIGLEDIPAFPNSHFIFKDLIASNEELKSPSFLNNIPPGYSKEDVQTIYTFLVKRKSIYILEPQYTFADVVKFYKDKLESLGYTYLFTIPEDDQYKVPGMYFINPQKTKGLHIYTVTNHDIWYEIISIQQAKTALTERKVALRLKNLEIKANKGKDLPQNTFWKLKFPTDWRYDTTLTPHLKVPSIFMSNAKRNSYLHIIPIKYTHAPVELLEFKDLKAPAYDFIKSWANDHGIRLNPSKAKLKNLIIQDIKGIEFCFPGTDLKNYPNLCFLILPNPRNTIYYAIIFWGEEVEFYDYVKRTIEPAE